jgi:hypothetical protein
LGKIPNNDDRFGKTERHIIGKRSIQKKGIIKRGLD